MKLKVIEAKNVFGGNSLGAFLISTCKEQYIEHNWI